MKADVTGDVKKESLEAFVMRTFDVIEFCSVRNTVRF